MRNGSTQIATQKNYIDNGTVRSGVARMDDEGESLVLGILRRRWYMLVLFVLISGAVGAFCYVNYEVPESVTEASMIYAPFPVIPGAPTHDPLEPVTIGEIAISNEILRSLAERNGLRIPPKSFRNLLTVKANRFSKLIRLRLNWTNGEEAIKLVNDLMDLVADRVVVERRKYLAECRRSPERALTDVNAKIDDVKKEVSDLRKKLQQALQQAGMQDSKSNFLSARYMGLENQLLGGEIELQTARDQISQMEIEVNAKRQQIKEEALRGKAAQYNERKRYVGEDRPEMKAIKKQLANFMTDNAHLEFDAWLAKLEQVGESDDELGAFENPAKSSVAMLRSQLNTISNRLDDRLSKITPLENKIAGLKKQRQQLDQDMKNYKGADIVTHGLLEDAERHLSDLQERRRKLAEQKSNYLLHEESTFKEVKVDTIASWDTTEQYSGKKKLFVLGSVGAFAALLIPLFAWEHFFPSERTCDRAARMTGLPIVGKKTFVKDNQQNPKNSVNTEAIRLLALRIQQSVQGSGAMVLFTGLNHERSSIPTITYLSECLARREERVLIIDACDQGLQNGDKNLAVKPQDDATSNGKESRDKSKSQSTAIAKNGNGTSLGLASFFSKPKVTAKDLIRSTNTPGVDIIPAGSESFPSEAFGTRRISTLLEECRNNYTLILVAGPSTNHPSDLQMLSSRADGILFTAPPDSKSSKRSDLVVQELAELGAPIIGIVS